MFQACMSVKKHGYMFGSFSLCPGLISGMQRMLDILPAATTLPEGLLQVFQFFMDTLHIVHGPCMMNECLLLNGRMITKYRTEAGTDNTSYGTSV
jgi:hypothetical protein